jgi:ATP-binding cassette subfamily B protein RaxB
MIYQSEAAECGLACMAMVANHHSHQLDLTTLRNRYSVSLKGANLQQLMQLANQLGLTPRALKLDLDDLKNLRTPCILHWEMNHFVVLKKSVAVIFWIILYQIITGISCLVNL